MSSNAWADLGGGIPDRGEFDLGRAVSVRPRTALEARAHHAAQAIAACDMCDARGYLPSGRVCHHVESARMTDEQRATIHAAVAEAAKTRREGTDPKTDNTPEEATP